MVTVTPRRHVKRNHVMGKKATEDLDVRAACARVGVTPEAQGRWLVQFAELEGKRLSTGDWLNIQWEVLIFSVGWIPNLRMPLPPSQVILKWQSWLCRGLERLKNGFAWEVELGRRVVRATYGSAGPKEEYRLRPEGDYRLFRSDSFLRDLGSAFYER